MPKGVYGSLPHDLTGQRFGKLVAQKIFRKADSGNMVWLCVCDCGATTKSWQRSLEHGKAKSCRSCSKLKGPLGAFNRVLHCYKKSAQVKNLAFDLTIDDFKILLDGMCHYCGEPPTRVSRSTSGATYLYNGIDRQNNMLGYVSANCVSCCSDCNYFKRARSEEEFLGKIARIFHHRVEEKK